MIAMIYWWVYLYIYIYYICGTYTDHGRRARTVNHKWRSVAVFLACESPRSKSLYHIVARIDHCNGVFVLLYVVVLFETIIIVIGWGVGGVCVRYRVYNTPPSPLHFNVYHLYTLSRCFYYHYHSTTPQPTLYRHHRSRLPPLMQQPLLGTIAAAYCIRLTNAQSISYLILEWIDQYYQTT